MQDGVQPPKSEGELAVQQATRVMADFEELEQSEHPDTKLVRLIQSGSLHQKFQIKGRTDEEEEVCLIIHRQERRN